MGLQQLQAHLHNEIVTCPDPDHNDPELQELHIQLDKVNKLLARVDLALYWESLPKIKDPQ